MKKIEILKLIKANKKINRNKELLSIVQDKSLSDTIIDKNYWFPNIEDLKEEFSILGEEIQKALYETIINKEYIKNTECNHEVRLRYFGLFSDTSECVFCNKSIPGKNIGNWEYSKNRNKYCVTLDSKFQYDEDGDYRITDGYNINQVYKIILNIIKDKGDEEEIDLIQEFKKLDLNRCEVNEEKKVKENYILIISGSNKQYIDKESYIYQKGLDIGLDFAQYFYGLLNTKIKLIDNTELLESIKVKEKISNYNNSVKFTSYDTIEELTRILDCQKEVPFKIIIDLSDLYNYKIEDNKVVKVQNNINLNEIYPNSHIIKIGNLSKKSLEELSNFLKLNKDINSLYAYQDKKYYYLENEQIKKDNLENTCEKVKRLLKNKEV